MKALRSAAWPPPAYQRLPTTRTHKHGRLQGTRGIRHRGCWASAAVAGRDTAEVSCGTQPWLAPVFTGEGADSGARQEENWNLHYANATMTVKQPLEPTAPHCRFSCRHRSDSPPTHDNPHAAADKATRHSQQSSASQLHVHLPERKHTATLAWQAPTSLANLGASHRHISRSGLRPSDQPPTISPSPNTQSGPETRVFRRPQSTDN